MKAMSLHRRTRRWVVASLVATPILAAQAQAATKGARSVSILAFGAKADGAAMNTRAIQSAIDHLAARGGGTVVAPAGVFVSGALFFKPGVNLHLAKGAVLKCTTEMSNFPRQRTRIEGHFEESFTPALINVDGCDGFSLTGQGVLDGSGRPIWDLFWKLQAAAPDPSNFPNLGLDRARLALIQNSKHVTVDGVTFKDSQFWNLHLYKCQDVLVRNARFEVPDDVKQAPSTDGVDLDSCQRVTIDGCYFSVTDDCIAAKGSKGPLALEDKDSPPVQHIRVRNCHFRRGHQAFSCGSEATVVRDVVIENSRVTGRMNFLMLKLRPDTPQLYEDIHVRGVSFDNAAGRIVFIAPWSQYKDLKGHAPPLSNVRNVTLSGLKGRFGSFGSIRPNPGQTTIRDLRFEDFDLQLSQGALEATGVTGLTFDKVVINGQPAVAPGG
jgi:polygalacturonase